MSRIVFPSDKICEEEEYFDGEGSYVDRKSSIRAAFFGNLHLDKRKYKAKVIPENNEVLWGKRGDAVVGIITRLKMKQAEIKISKINGKATSSNFTGIIHINKISKDYVDSIEDVFQVGDIIRAKVLNSFSLPYRLYTNEKSLGVIMSNCPTCGIHLKKEKKYELSCNLCNSKFKKKTSADY